MVSCKIYSAPNDDCVGPDGMKKVINQINMELLDDDSYEDSNVIVFDRNPLSKKERTEIVCMIRDHCMVHKVKLTPDAIEIYTSDDRNIKVFLIFGGVNAVKGFVEDKKDVKENTKRARESIESIDDSLASFGDFEDITGQGSTQALAPFFPEPAKEEESSDADNEDDE